MYLKGVTVIANEDLQEFYIGKNIVEESRLGDIETL